MNINICFTPQQSPIQDYRNNYYYIPFINIIELFQTINYYVHLIFITFPIELGGVIYNSSTNDFLMRVISLSKLQISNL